VHEPEGVTVIAVAATPFATLIATSEEDEPQVWAPFTLGLTVKFLKSADIILALCPLDKVKTKLSELTTMLS